MKWENGDELSVGKFWKGTFVVYLKVLSWHYLKTLRIDSVLGYYMMMKFLM